MMKREKIEQTELFKTDVTWFHIFKEIIRNGTWARLSSNSKSLYPVIKAHINWESGIAFPSLDTLQKFSGLSRPSITKALRELEAEGLLTKETKEGRHSNYTLVEKFDVKDGEGRPAASVSFDYLPSHVSDAVAELKNFMAKGLTLPDGKTNYIKIDNLTLNIHSGSGHNINIHAGINDETLMTGINDIKAKKDTDAARLVTEMVEKYSKECG